MSFTGARLIGARLPLLVRTRKGSVKNRDGRRWRTYRRNLVFPSLRLGIEVEADFVSGRRENPPELARELLMKHEISCPLRNQVGTEKNSPCESMRAGPQ